MIILENITEDLGLKKTAVQNVIDLIKEGGTIPFIARYRKERTGGLDETEIRNINEKLEYYTELEKRKETILKTIKDQDKLTPELEKQIIECREKQKLEDLYLPYKPKRTTKATIAREKGLGPLADIIMAQEILSKPKHEIIAPFINPEKGIETQEQALAGALDIVAEQISDNAEVRGALRANMEQFGTIASKVRKEWEGKSTKFDMYYGHSESLKKVASHRMLAIRRGAKEEVISWKIEMSQDQALSIIESKILKNRNSTFIDELLSAVKSSYDRLIYPSIQVEVFCAKLDIAGKEAIDVFSRNAKNLLLAPPAGQKVIMGIDPGFRTGCKVVVIDNNGNFKEYKAIFPHEPQNKKEEAEKIILDFINKYSIELISIGNGTASKETSMFINEIIKKHKMAVKPVVVSEAGASVYSASAVAISEFPELDVTVRGGISIARRLQDPLAELVKIDPKSIGVGQYQHDVNQLELKKSLDLTVESCVNYVGVNLNSASAELLSYVSGIGKLISKNIVSYRAQKGSFKNKKELLEVPKLGKKAFEQCAGFLRIHGGDNSIDNSAIHPESYYIVEQMAQDLGVDIEKLIGNEKLISKIDINKYVTDATGLPTLTDIIQELKKPGHDPREVFEDIKFNCEINDIADLKTEMILDGTVTNVTNFGAFVDIGVHQDGLVHISKMSTKFVKDPHTIVSVGEKVKVKVLSINAELKRIGLELIAS